MTFTWTDYRIDTLKRMRTTGHSYTEIAKKLGISRNSAMGKARRLGLPTHESKSSRSLINKRNISRATATVPRVKAAPELSGRPLPPDMALPPSLNIALIDLEPHHCRFIPGDDRRFCGHPRIDASPYCITHSLIAYRRP